MRGKNPKNYQTYLLNYENIEDLKGDNSDDFLINFDDDYENLESVSYMMDQLLCIGPPEAAFTSKAPLLIHQTPPRLINSRFRTNTA
jgi:hypothetical protein